jgi:hypothetical protein
MSHLESTDSCLTFDDILEAVQDSKRGRWFLQEFETRIQKRESAGLLQAIQRLERRMEGLTAAGAPLHDIDKVRGAIATARKDMLQLGFGKQAMSAEGRLFADLAELARKSLPANDDCKDKIVRSLQLVDEIDRAIDAATTSGTRFFMADAQVFENAAAADPAPTSTATGATLIVRRVDAEDLQDGATEVKDLRPAAATEAKVDHPRIVIIRRRAEDMPEVNIDVPAESESAA